MTDKPWPSEWLRSVLMLAVLRVLADGPTYGYAIAVALESVGLGVVKGGTLYPLLSRLETAGYVTTRWGEGEGGPGRKYFELTDSGRAEFESRAAAWGEFTRVSTTFIERKQP